MSAVADLINKLLRQRFVYFQGLDLRAEISGVGFSKIPHINSHNHTHMYSECDERSFCSMIWWAFLYSAFCLGLFFSKYTIVNQYTHFMDHPDLFLLEICHKCASIWRLSMVTQPFLPLSSLSLFVCLLSDVSMKITNMGVMKKIWLYSCAETLDLQAPLS